MAIDRRAVLRLLAGGLLACGAPGLPRSTGAAPRRRLYLGVRAGPRGGYRASGFRASGAAAFDLGLPDRGHSFAVRPDGRTAVVFARRPGRFALALDLARGAAAAEFAAPRDRHFYGHGAFGPDGRFLYASENDFAGERGVIGVYDAAKGYRRVGELSSHGIGPHELALLSDGVTLVIANGGILTRPDLPRVKLNVASMSPSLCHVHRLDGRLLKERRLGPGLHQLGIRHLAVGRDDTVAVAMQYEGPRGRLMPLAAVDRAGAAAEAPLVFLSAAPAVWRAMKQYCGSACFDSEGRMLAVSAPRGNLVTFWDAAAGSYLWSAPVLDGSGIAPGERSAEFLASSGHRGVTVIDARSGASTPLDAPFVNTPRWDNHLATV